MSAEKAQPPPALSREEDRTINEIGCLFDDRRETYYGASQHAAGGIDALGVLKTWAVEHAAHIDRRAEEESLTPTEATVAKGVLNAVMMKCAENARSLQDLKLKAQGGTVAMADAVSMLRKRQGFEPPPLAEVTKLPTTEERQTGTRPEPKPRGRPAPGIKAQRQAEAKEREAKGAVAKQATQKREAGRRQALENANKPNTPPVAVKTPGDRTRPRKSSRRGSRE